MIIEPRDSERSAIRRWRGRPWEGLRGCRKAVCGGWLIGLLAAVELLAGCDQERPESSAEQPPKTAAVASDAVDDALAAAEEYLSTEELLKAEMILVKLIEKAPGELRARELMGQVLGLKAQELAASGREEAAAESWRQAYRHYKVAVEIDPDSAGLRQSAGVIALAAGEREAALAQFVAATRLDPSNPQHPLYAAQIHLQEREYEEAEVMLDRVLAVDPDEPLAHASRAALALERGEHSRALRHIAVARQIAPKDLRLRVQEARIHRLSGDPGRALELLWGLSPRERGEMSVAEELSASFTAMGEHERAAAVWEQRFRLHAEGGGDHVAAVRAGESMLRAGRREEAMRWLRVAQVAGGNAREVRDLEARIREAERR